MQRIVSGLPGQDDPAARGSSFIWRFLDARVRTHLRSYLLQCVLATLFLVATLLLMDVVLRTAIVVAVASSVFIVFVMPHSVAATPRRVIGGHVVAVVTGGLFSAVAGAPMDSSRAALDVMAALAVGLSILVMVATDTEHPPAAGTVLGLVIHGWSLSSVAFILSSVLILSTVRALLGRRLVNLL